MLVNLRQLNMVVSEGSWSDSSVNPPPPQTPYQASLFPAAEIIQFKAMRRQTYSLQLQAMAMFFDLWFCLWWHVCTGSWLRLTQRDSVSSVAIFPSLFYKYGNLNKYNWNQFTFRLHTGQAAFSICAWHTENKQTQSSRAGFQPDFLGNAFTWGPTFSLVEHKTWM